MVLSVLLMTMGTCKAFKHYMEEAFRKKAESKVIDRSKGAEVEAYLGGELKQITKLLRYIHVDLSSKDAHLYPLPVTDDRRFA